MLSKHKIYEHRPLGIGGGGIVYAGRTHFDLGEYARPCAVKVLHESMAEQPEQVTRFADEAILGYELAGHPHLVATRTFGTSPEGWPYLVMDLEGPTAEQLETHICGDFAVIWTLAAAVTSALLHLQRHGRVHGDINAGNIFLGRDGAFKLGDFGKSAPIERADDRRVEPRQDDRRGLALTLTSLATGASAIDRDGAPRPLPDSIPPDLRTLIRGLLAPAERGLSIAEAAAFIDERRACRATPEAMRELVRAGHEARKLDILAQTGGRSDTNSDVDPVPFGVADDASATRAPSAVAAAPPVAGPEPSRSRWFVHAVAIAGACAVCVAATSIWFALRSPRVVIIEPPPASQPSTPAPPPTPELTTAPSVEPGIREALPPPEPAVREAPVEPVEPPKRGASRAPVPTTRSSDRGNPVGEPVQDGRAPDVRAQSSIGSFRDQFLIDDTVFLLNHYMEVNGVRITVDRGMWTGNDSAVVRVRRFRGCESSHE